jgi:hypothetical protein
MMGVGFGAAVDVLVRYSRKCASRDCPMTAWMILSGFRDRSTVPGPGPRSVRFSGFGR